MSAAGRGPELVTIASGAWCDPVTGACSDEPDDEGSAEEENSERL